MTTKELMKELASPPPMRDSGLGYKLPVIRNRTKCADGFEVSIQASESHYCKPRGNNGPYTHFELGHPSTFEPLLAEYAECKGRIFGYVPFDVVEAVINKHGGPAQNAGRKAGNDCYRR